MKHIHIDTYSTGNTDVWVLDNGKLLRCHSKITRSSLVRAQRMQLALFDAMKGQTPDDSL